MRRGKRVAAGCGRVYRNFSFILTLIREVPSLSPNFYFHRSATEIPRVCNFSLLHASFSLSLSLSLYIYVYISRAAQTTRTPVPVRIIFIVWIFSLALTFVARTLSFDYDHSYPLSLFFSPYAVLHVAHAFTHSRHFSLLAYLSAFNFSFAFLILSVSLSLATIVTRSLICSTLLSCINRS